MDVLPGSNADYATVDYWNGRYETEDSYDWFKSYCSFRHILQEFLHPNNRILVLGCGNSPLSEDMFADGFKHIVNIDFSEVVIQKMKSRSEATKAMEWHVMDAKNLTFSDASFDAVVEKGTLDAIMANDKDPWNPQVKTKETLKEILSEVSRVLKPNGTFVSLTFAQPHFRLPFYAKRRYDWSTETRTFSDGFHYFAYVMQKGKPLVLTNGPHVKRTASPCVVGTLVDSESEDFLCAIDDF